MRILEVLPTYPGDPYDGSAVYERNLNSTLVKRGAYIEVLTTRASRLRHNHQFSITWPDELPARDEHDGVPIHRFHACDTERIGAIISNTVRRRWSREDYTEGEVVAGSTHFTEFAVAQARKRPSRVDLLADIGRGPLVPRLVARLLRVASDFDVILAGYAPFSLSRQVLWAARRTGVPAFLLPFIHENDRYHQFDSLLRTYEQAATVFTLSPHTSEFLQRYVRHAKPVALGAGATALASPGMSSTEFRDRHQLGDRPIVLFVGRKEKGKRYDMAVDAVERSACEVVFVMVGRDVDGVSIESDRVRHLGVLPEDELSAAYEACDVFLFPSMFESFGMVFLDAWLRSKPVIGNASCGAAAALIDDGVDGFLCRDADEVGVALRRLIEDPDLRASMGAAGRAKTLEHYTWGRVADRALAAFEQVTRAHRRDDNEPIPLMPVETER